MYEGNITYEYKIVLLFKIFIIIITIGYDII